MAAVDYSPRRCDAVGKLTGIVADPIHLGDKSSH